MIKSPIIRPSTGKIAVHRSLSLGVANYDLNELYSPDNAFAKSIVLDLVAPKYPPGLANANTRYIYDKSKYGNHGTITGATWVKLPSGLWVQYFDGTDDNVDCGAATTLQFTIAQTFTMLCWAVPVLDSADRIIGCNYPSDNSSRGWQFRIASDNSLRMVVAQTGIIYKYSTTAVLTGANQWKCLAGSWDASQCRTYLNGVEDTTAESAGTLAGITSTTNFVIGQFSNKNNTQVWKGNLWPGFVVTPALTAAQIAQFYQQTRHLFGV